MLSKLYTPLLNIRKRILYMHFLCTVGGGHLYNSAQCLQNENKNAINYKETLSNQIQKPSTQHTQKKET